MTATLPKLNPLDGAQPVLLSVDDADQLGALVDQLVRIEQLDVDSSQKWQLVTHYQAETLASLTRAGVETVAKVSAADLALAALRRAKATSKAAVTLKLRTSPWKPYKHGQAREFVAQFLAEIEKLQQVAREALEIFGKQEARA